MIASPEDAMKRERGYLSVENGKGSIMNYEVLKRIKEINLQCVQELKKDFRIYSIDTSFGETKDNPGRTAEIVADIVLTLVEEQIKEEIIVLPKNRIVDLFAGRTWLAASDASAVASLFAKSGEFRPREEVEANTELVQALPIVVVRNAAGAILRLKRRERSEENPLHEKVVIWAGGHVRKEDADNGNPLIHCAVREVQEELRLNIEPNDIRLLGAIYLNTVGSTPKHVAIAFEWCAEKDDVAVALSSAEFFERRGTSLSGSFANLKDLATEIECGKLTEPWSCELVRECLAKGSFKFSRRLF